MQIKCEYCGNFIDDTDLECPICGAENDNLKRVANGVPTTIEELKQWYIARNLPPEETTRFFIGKDYKQPKAFGIYQDKISGNFIVYKNKSDGTRAIRYEGKDETYAVNELYLKLKEEIDNQRKNQNKNNFNTYHSETTIFRQDLNGNTYNKSNRSATIDSSGLTIISSNNNGAQKIFIRPFTVVLFVILIFSICVCCFGFPIGNYSIGNGSSHYDSGYYDSSYYDSGYYDSGYDSSDSYYDSGYYDSDYYDSGYDSSDSYWDSDWDSSYNWDSGSSWDSGYSDWGSDW